MVRRLGSAGSQASPEIRGGSNEARVSTAGDGDRLGRSVRGAQRRCVGGGHRAAREARVHGRHCDELEEARRQVPRPAAVDAPRRARPGWRYRSGGPGRRDRAGRPNRAAGRQGRHRRDRCKGRHRFAGSAGRRRRRAQDHRLARQLRCTPGNGRDRRRLPDHRRPVGVGRKRLEERRAGSGTARADWDLSAQRVRQVRQARPVRRGRQAQPPSQSTRRRTPSRRRASKS